MCVLKVDLILEDCIKQSFRKLVFKWYSFQQQKKSVKKSVLNSKCVFLEQHLSISYVISFKFVKKFVKREREDYE